MTTTPDAPGASGDPDALSASGRQARSTSTRSSFEVQLEAFLVARCGVDAVLPRREPTRRVDWVLAAPDPANRAS